MRSHSRITRTETVTLIPYVQTAPKMTVQYDEYGEAITSEFKQEYQIQMSCQPAGEDLQRLEEGRRQTESMKIWSEHPFDNKDIIVRKGKRFQVDMVKDWSTSSTIPHYAGTMTRYLNR